jgi:hypothetical protein
MHSMYHLWPWIRRSRGFLCTVHTSPESMDIIICELEPLHSISSQSLAARTQPQTPTRMLKYQATNQEWESSTKRKSKPLHGLRGRSDLSFGTSADLIGTVNDIQSQLISSTSIETLFDTIMGTVLELAGFDRVMVYWFDECKCGAVVVEYVNPLVSEDFFIGPHFPSSDLPPRTRQLYKADRVQILRNRTSEKASLIYRSPDGVTALDLTGLYLRDVTPDQVKFFSEINASSATTIYLVVEDDLWGLITCHSYGATTVEVSPPLQRRVVISGSVPRARWNVRFLLRDSRLVFYLQPGFREIPLPPSSLLLQTVFFGYLPPRSVC